MADEEKKEVEEEVKKETIEDVVRETHAEETSTEDESKDESKEEAEKEIKEKEKAEPEVDLEEVTQEVEKKAKEEVKTEILKALGVTEGEKDKAEEAGWKSPWEKRGEERPRDWQEAVEAGADLAEFRQAEAQRKAQQQEEQDKLKQEKTREELNKYWDRQLDELRETGKIPKIAPEVQAKLKAGQKLTEEDVRDPGVKAQRELFETMYKVSDERKNRGMDEIYNIKEIYYEHYGKKQPAGADAPVSGGQKTPVTPPSDEIDYKDIHETPMEDIIRNG